MESASRWTRTAVKIPSLTPGWKLDAWKYVPNGDKKPPVIVMGHGLACVKAMGLDLFAEEFAARGYAVVPFDYRRWGESDGDPRNVVQIRDQIEDYKSVIQYCREQDDLDGDRIVVWGFSFAGGHVQVLAVEDPNLAAAIAMCPFTTGAAVKHLVVGMAGFRTIALALFDAIRQCLGFRPLYIPATAPPGHAAACAPPGAVEGFASITKNPADFVNKISASSLLPFGSRIAMKGIENVDTPILFLAGQDDKVHPPHTVEVAARKARNADYIVCSGDHFNQFVGNDAHDVSMAKQLEFLRAHVPTSGAQY